MSRLRPYGTPNSNDGTAFPTLKRGANKRCAYGAGDEMVLDFNRSHRVRHSRRVFVFPARVGGRSVGEGHR
jgi:hypothetical protein